MSNENDPKYLISIGIGPVQDFIASARRSRDLWFGSWLLSELSKTAANEIVKQHKKESLIFPSIADPTELNENSEFNVVNKIVALVENPNELGKTIHQAMQKRLDDIRNDAYQNVKGSFPKELQDKAEEQVKDLIEFFWTAVKFDEKTSDYEKARERVEYLFAARKATRNFTSTKAWSGNVPKSSLDGQRESVIHEDVYDAVRNGKMTKEELRRQFGVREGERLCGVGLLKRHGNRKSRINSTNDDSFFSTSHVASLPLLETLTDKVAVEKYIKRLKEIGMKDSDFNKVPLPKGATEHAAFGRNDGQLLFEERFGDYFDSKEVFVDKDHKEKKKTVEARQALRDFLKTALDEKTPLPYYALLLADGDAMGKAIDSQKSKTDHQNLSAELSLFAKNVIKIVEIQHKGSLIYSGGDDVLAFVPLHTVLGCAKELADLFAQKLDRFKIIENGRTYSPTLSVGIAVAHHLEPLEDALELARKAEKAAKAIDGKNALAVIVDKRSGISRTLKGRWGTIDKRLNQFVKWHIADKIPDGAAYQLRDLANRLEVSEDIADKAILNKIKIVEAKRILKRKKRDKGQKEIEQNTLDVLFASLQNGISVEELADELIIAKIFADAIRLSQPKEEKKDE